MRIIYICQCGAKMGPVVDPWKCKAGHLYRRPRLDRAQENMTAVDDRGRIRFFAPHDDATSERLRIQYV